MVSIKVNCALESDAIIVVVSVSFVLLCKCNLLAFILQVFTQKNTSHIVENIKKKMVYYSTAHSFLHKYGVTVAPLCGADSGWPTVPTAAMRPFLLVDAVGTSVLRVRAESADYMAYTLRTRRTHVPTRIINVDFIPQHIPPPRGAWSGVICTGTGGWSVWAFFRIPRALSRFSVSARRVRQVC